MTKKMFTKPLGIVITKTPAVSTLVANALKIGRQATSKGHKVTIFLLSDGVWLAKKNQIGTATEELKILLNNGAAVMASHQHLKGAGITEDDLWDGITLSDKPYHDLVENVMEHWDRVITI
jgi:sulfur relay (sulfurtransferase) complex TusBCD TusD component (DsrE family)